MKLGPMPIAINTARSTTNWAIFRVLANNTNAVRKITVVPAMTVAKIYQTKWSQVHFTMLSAMLDK